MAPLIGARSAGRLFEVVSRTWRLPGGASPQPGRRAVDSSPAGTTLARYREEDLTGGTAVRPFRSCHPSIRGQPAVHRPVDPNGRRGSVPARSTAVTTTHLTTCQVPVDPSDRASGPGALVSAVLPEAVAARLRCRRARPRRGRRGRRRQRPAERAGVLRRPARRFLAPGIGHGALGDDPVRARPGSGCVPPSASPMRRSSATTRSTCSIGWAEKLRLPGGGLAAEYLPVSRPCPIGE